MTNDVFADNHTLRLKLINYAMSETTKTIHSKMHYYVRYKVSNLVENIIEENIYNVIDLLQQELIQINQELNQKN